MKPIQVTVEIEKTIVLQLSIDQAKQLYDFVSQGLRATSSYEDEDQKIQVPRLELFKALNMALGM